MQIRDEGIPFRPEWVDLLLESHDILRGLVEAFSAGRQASSHWRVNFQQLTDVIRLNSAGVAQDHFRDGDRPLFSETAAAEIGGLDVYLSKWRPGIPDKGLIAAVRRKFKLLSSSASRAGYGRFVEVLERSLSDIDARKEEEWDQHEIDTFRQISDELRKILKKKTSTDQQKLVAELPAERDCGHGERRLEIKEDYVEMLEDMVGDFAVYAQRVRHDLSKTKPLVKPRAHHWLDGLGADLTRFSRALIQSCRRLHLVPLSRAFNRLPRLVRDAAKREGKKVDLVITGGETEIVMDQLEKISEALIHLIRNAVDHGVEAPEERIKLGKDEKGQITVSARHSGGVTTIDIGDDGRGIDFDAIRRKAVELGRVTPEESKNLASESMIGLMFLNGLSTKSVADAISGRGVGMDIVKESVGELNGSLEIESDVGKGTLFRINIPLGFD